MKFGLLHLLTDHCPLQAPGKAIEHELPFLCCGVGPRSICMYLYVGLYAQGDCYVGCINFDPHGHTEGEANV